MSGIDLGFEPDIDKVAGDDGHVGALLAHMVDEFHQPVAREIALALDLPVQVAGDPLVHQVPRPDGRHGREVDVGQMGESYHCGGNATRRAPWKRSKSHCR